MDTFGKGLSSLIPGVIAPTPHPTSGHPLPQGEDRVRVLPPHDPDEGEVMSVLQVAPDRIDPNPRQPRTIFNEEKLQELKASIKEYGILEPLASNKLKTPIVFFSNNERFQNPVLFN